VYTIVPYSRVGFGGITTGAGGLAFGAAFFVVFFSYIMITPRGLS
jgi:hypothetical protein